MQKEHFSYKFDDLFNPLLHALHKLGGAGNILEIEEQVATILNLNDKQLNEIHRGNTTKFSYRLAWARNYLKLYGLLENSSRGVWALTELGLKTESVDKNIVKKKVVTDDKKARLIKKAANANKFFSEHHEVDEIQNLTWREDLIELLKEISPDAFERICQRLLRELGFQNVEVTGRSNDGGIDGKGLLKVSILSFHVIFQAKRYKGTVSPSIVRDFRGAMIGRADKGLIITTGTFSREAKREAARDGANPIDLIDGIELAQKIKDLRMGIEVELIEKVNINSEWFKMI